MTYKARIFLFSFLALIMAACSQQSAAPVNTDEIVRTVLTELENQPASTVDTEAVAADVLDRVNGQLESQGSTVAISNPSLATADLELQDRLVSLYEHANPATVYIIVPPFGSGSGWVYNEDGYIVTNNHVVEDGNRFEVVFSNGERQFAELVGTDVDSDLAVLKVDELPAGIDPLPLADTDSIKVGQFVIAIGNPFGEQGSMSLGIISGLDRSLQSQRGNAGGSYSLPEVIQTDAPINPGNSGGPLINLQGEVVGVNSAIRTTSGTNSGVGFSVPVAAVARIVPALIESGEYHYSYMGVGFDEEVSLDEQEVFGLTQTAGAYVLSVEPSGPAAQAGLRAASRTTGQGGDLIIAIDGQTIQDFSDLNSYLVLHTSAGDTIQVTVLRNGEELTFPLTLGTRP